MDQKINCEQSCSQFEGTNVLPVCCLFLFLFIEKVGLRLRNSRMKYKKWTAGLIFGNLWSFKLKIALSICLASVKRKKLLEDICYALRLL